MSASEKQWYVADPVHHFVEFGRHQDLVRALAATRPFQRLRRISQLGLASLVFPGAVHSRFSHSLGAAHLAARVGKQLAVSEEGCRALIAAALVHDIGHGPFSHSFEHALEHVVSERPTHEQWTTTIIENLLAEPLRAQGVDPDTVSALICATEGSSVPAFMRQVISSQLDVDRMDYLCRDAHFTGVPIGQVDLHYLIRNLTIIDQGGAGKTLGLTSKGVSSYEAFAFARHVMTETVYYHKQVATFESMMEEFLRLLVESKPVGFEPELVPALRKSASGTTSSLASRLLDAYVDISEDQIWTTISASTRRQDRVGMLSRMLQQRKPCFSARVTKHRHEELAKALRDGGLGEHQCRVREQPRSLYRQSRGEQVYVLGAHGTPEHIGKRSRLVSALGDQVDTEAILVVFDDAVKDRALDIARGSFSLESMPPSKPPTRVRPDTALDVSEREG